MAHHAATAAGGAFRKIQNSTQDCLDCCSTGEQDFAARKDSGLILLVLKHELRPPAAKQ
jgi:hypothetical protein